MSALSETVGIVLAAGLSRRFGATNKLLAPLRGQPLASYIARSVAALPLMGRIAVCPAGDEGLTAIFRTLDLDVIFNDDSAAGQASSLALGVAAALPFQPRALLVCLADMPFITGAHLRDLVDGLDAQCTVTASAPAINAAPSPPAAFAQVHFAALMAQRGDQGARALIKGASKHIAPAAELLDFDTQEDFDAVGLG